MQSTADQVVAPDNVEVLASQTPVPETTVVCGQHGFTEIRSNSTDRG
jgi:hypothetical protein